METTGQSTKRSIVSELKKFGPNYSKYENKPKEAIEFLLEKGEGQVIGAYKKRGLGKIDIIWGNNKEGLKHIRKRHFIEQDDFKSYEEMAQKISEALKSGKIENDRGNYIILHNEMRLILNQTDVYNEEDEFIEKIWILTSYDQSRPKAEKQKVVSKEETTLEKARTYPSSSSTINNGLGHGEVINRYQSISLICERKDMLKKSLEQHFGQYFLKK